MGTSHALAYHSLPAFDVVGLVSRKPRTRQALAARLGGNVPIFGRFATALRRTEPDVVCIATYTETHAPYAIAALRAGAHVFVEKPLALTVAEAQRVIAAARRARRALVVGYILRQHPSWTKFVEIARTLGKPLVMRMNLNQQSSGDAWRSHRNLMRDMSPIVDCGVHYVDVMCQMTGATPVRVHAIGARLSRAIRPDMYNYGQLQVRFDDGSCGWYEAGWGPMMSEVAYCVKDVVGPRGCVSIVGAHEGGSSSDIDSHTKMNRLRLHRSDLDARGRFRSRDRTIDLSDEPDHLELCRREQRYLLQGVRGQVDLRDHQRDAVNSLRIVLAADQSVRTGKVIRLQ